DVVANPDSWSELQPEVYWRPTQSSIDSKRDSRANEDFMVAEPVSVGAAKSRWKSDCSTHSEIQIEGGIRLVFQALGESRLKVAMQPKSRTAPEGEIERVRASQPVFGVQPNRIAQHQPKAPSGGLIHRLSLYRWRSEEKDCKAPEGGDS